MADPQADGVPDEDRARGLMVGLLAGDAAGELLSTSEDDAVHGSCLGQLACFTVEGMIRGLVRFEDKGIGNPVYASWRAWCRWAVGQGIRPADFTDYPLSTGWLSAVGALKERRGSAPATVDAIRGHMGTMEAPVGTSAGHHALNRNAPAALFDSVCNDLPAAARELAAMTHGHPDAWEASAAGALVLASALRADDVDAAVGLALGRADSDRVAELVGRMGDHPPSTAADALASGLRSVRAGGDLADVLRRALESGPGAATFAGAVFGSLHGVAGLDLGLVRRLEMGWVADRLARDALRQQVEHPGLYGMYGATPSDAMWQVLYPPN